MILQNKALILPVTVLTSALARNIAGVRTTTAHSPADPHWLHPGTGAAYCCGDTCKALVDNRHETKTRAALSNRSLFVFGRLVQVSKNYRSVIRACMEDMHQAASKFVVLLLQ